MKLRCCFFLVFFTITCKEIFAQQHCDTLAYQTLYLVNKYSGLFPQKLFIGKDYMYSVSTSSPSDTWRGEGSEIILMKLTLNGTPLWSKNIGVSGPAFQNGDFLLDAKQTKDGGFIFAGLTQGDHNSSYDGWLAKLDQDGNVQWTSTYDSRASKLNNVIQLEDGSFIATGVQYTNFTLDVFQNVSRVYNSEMFMIHTDKDGKKIWARAVFSRDLNEPFSVTQLRDGNIAIAGFTRNNGYSDIPLYFIAKIDITTGAFLWTNGYAYPENFSFQPSIKEMPDGRLCIHDGNNIMYFDANGNAIKNFLFTIDDPNWQEYTFVKYIGTTSDGQDCYSYFKSRTCGLFKIRNDSAVTWAHTYRVSKLLASMSELRDVVIINDNFYILTQVQADDFPGVKANYYAYILKANAEGKTTCTDTIRQRFIFTSDWPRSVPVPQFQDDGSPLFPLFRAIHSNDQAPYSVKDCFTASCCNDTLMYKNVFICAGSNYKLPDGKSVSEAGVYPTPFKNFKGCDSVIFTTVTLQQPVTVSLKNDTCFAKSDIITYRLKYQQPVQYHWQDGSSDSVYNATQPGQYWVKVSTACNIASDSVTIFPNCGFPVYIPNAFTPNNDGRNDVFRIPGLHSQHLLNLTVYNRFGEKIFNTSDPSKGWNGMRNGVLQQAGTYIYLIRYRDVGSGIHELKGTVVLIR